MGWITGSPLKISVQRNNIQSKNNLTKVIDFLNSMTETAFIPSLEEAIATGNRLKDEARSLVQDKNYTAAI